MKQAYFYLPCGNKLDSESPNFRGYYDVKQSWNGWKCPKFEEKSTLVKRTKLKTHLGVISDLLCTLYI